MAKVFRAQFNEIAQRFREKQTSVEECLKELRAMNTSFDFYIHYLGENLNDFPNSEPEAVMNLADEIYDFTMLAIASR